MFQLASCALPTTRCCCLPPTTGATRSPIQVITEPLQQAGQGQSQLLARIQAAADETGLAVAVGPQQSLQQQGRSRQRERGLAQQQQQQQLLVQAEGVHSPPRTQFGHSQQQQEWQWQRHVGATAPEMRQAQMPVHAQRHVQQMAQLVLACDDVLQLQAVLSIHLHRFTPSCMVTAMQQLQRLRRQQLRHCPSDGSSSSSNGAGCVMQSVQLQLAVQLSQGMLRQLPVVSGSCLAAFLAAAASMRLVVPGPVLAQMVQHLVHKALRLAGQHMLQQAQAAAAGQQQPVQDAQGSLRGAGSTQGRSWHPVALSAWALAKLRLQSGPLWQELVSIAGEQLPQLALQDSVLLAWALAKAGQHQPRMFNALQQQLLPHVRRLSPNCISSLLWSYAAAGQSHHSWLCALSSAAADSMERFTPRQVATSLWACGRLRHADPRMLSAARVQALACLPDMQPQALANLAWALATLGCSDAGLVAAVVHRAMDVVDELSAQGLSNVAWAVVKLQQQARQEAAAQLSLAPVSQLSGRSGADSSSGLSGDRLPQQQLLHLCQGLLQAVCDAATSGLSAAKPQEVCNLLWACAQLKLRHEPCLTAAAARLSVLAEDASPLDLAQALWALETLRFRRTTTQHTLLQPALTQLHLFGPQALSNLAWAVASSGMRFPPALPGAVAQQLQALLPQMTPQGLSTTLWALSKLGPVPKQLIHTASTHIRQQLHLYNAQDLCNVAMVTAKAGYKQPQLLHALAAAASSAAAATLAAAIPSAVPAAADSSESSNGFKGRVAWSRQQVASGASGVGPMSLSSTRAMHLTGLGVCNLVWAFAGMGWCCPHTLQQLQQLAGLHLSKLPPRNVAALMHGFALLREPISQLLAALLPQQAWQQSGAQQGCLAHSQHLYSPAAGLGTEGEGAGLHAEVHRCLHVLRGWPADSLALLLHAVAIAGVQDQHPALVLAVLRCLSRTCAAAPLGALRQQQLHLALTWLSLHWGLATASPARLASSRGIASSTLGTHSGRSSHCSSMAAPSGRGDVQQLLSAALTLDGVNTCSPQQLQQKGSTGHDPGAALDEGHQDACARGDSSSSAATADRLRQHVPLEAASAACLPSPPGLAVPHVAAPVACGGEVQALASGLLKGSLARLCTRAWQQHEASSQLSAVEQLVVTVLRGMGLTPCTQNWVALTHVPYGKSSTPAAAAAAATSSRALAVRVGVPAHALGPGRSPLALCVLPRRALSSSLPRRVLGASALEHRCLAAAGWEVVLLSQEEWEATQCSQREQLLRQLCGVSSPTEPT